MSNIISTFCTVEGHHQCIYCARWSNEAATVHADIVADDHVTYTFADAQQSAVSLAFHRSATGQGIFFALVG